MNSASDYDDTYTDFIIFGGKSCTQCGERKPLNREYFCPDRHELDGFTTACRECRRASDRRRWQRRREKAGG